MGRLAQEEFIRRAKEKNEKVRNGSIEIRGSYVNNTTPVECYCNIHDIDWSPTPVVIYGGSGCKQCKSSKLSKIKSKSNEQFIREVYERNEYVRRGDIEILSKYVGVDTKIKCRCTKHDWIYWVAPSSLLNNIGCRKCGRERTTASQKKSHEQFVTEVYELDPDFTVIGTYVTSWTLIDFMCPIGHIFPMKPIDFLNGRRCPYCSNRRVLVGYNDIATTRPDIFSLLTNKEDGYKYVAGSKHKTNFTCPLCGKIQKKEIADVSVRGFSCNNCSDSISFPNKFGRFFCSQLPIGEYDIEWQPEWVKPFFYDIHFVWKSVAYIIEWDGEQHFEETNAFKLTLKEIQQRDAIKEDLARKNNVHVIRIDCRKSECEYIKNNILNSELSLMFDLSNIDWEACNMHAQKNLVKEACRMYEENTKNYKEIAKALHIGESTARQYIRRGIVSGWCTYDSEKFKKDREIRRGYPIYITDEISGVSNYFQSIHECMRWAYANYGIKLYHATILRHCELGTPYNGFIFSLENLTIQN